MKDETGEHQKLNLLFASKLVEDVNWLFILVFTNKWLLCFHYRCTSRQTRRDRENILTVLTTTRVKRND